MDPAQLQELLALIEREWPFDVATYPTLAQQPDPFAFAVEHILRHNDKSTGAIAETLEAADHGRPIDHAKLNLAALKLFVNSLRLLAVLGITGDEITAYITEWAIAKHQPACPNCGATMERIARSFWQCQSCFHAQD